MLGLSGCYMVINLYPHQEVALAYLRANDGFALFMEQGTGKTFPILFRLAELAQSKKIKSALIVAPKAVCASWEAKVKMLSIEQQKALSSISLLIRQYDIVWRRSDISTGTFDAVVFDESHFIKSPSAKRTKACIAISSRAKYRYILTGTPTSNGAICNIWSQFAAIDPIVVTGKNHQTYIYPNCLGGDSYFNWIKRVAYLDPWHKPYKYKNVDELQEIIGNHSYRITKEDCLDLPEKLPDEIFTCELASMTKRPYRDMARKSAIVELDTVATNPLTRAVRLRQMCSGYIVTDEGKLKTYDCSKKTILKDYLKDFEGKFVIFCEFTHSIDTVSSILHEINIAHVILDGRQKDKGIWKQFQSDQKIQGIICQYMTGSAGIDLFSANTVIFFEPTLRSDLNEQAKDRIHRPGQNRACSYIYLITPNTIEEAIYQSLKNYEDFGAALFTKYINEYTKGGKV